MLIVYKYMYMYNHNVFLPGLQFMFIPILCIYHIQWSGLFRKDVQIMWAVVKSIHAHKHKTITFALNVLCASIQIS